MPDGLDTVTEVVENVATLNATTGGEEAANDTGDMVADVECLRIVHADALYTKTETTYAREHHRLAFSEFLFQNIL